MRASRRDFLLLAGAAALRPRRSAAGVRGGALTRDITIVNALGDLDDPNHPDTGPAVITPRMLADARIAKILGGNFIRYAREVWGA